MINSVRTSFFPVIFISISIEWDALRCVAYACICIFVCYIHFRKMNVCRWTVPFKLNKHNLKLFQTLRKANAFDCLLKFYSIVVIKCVCLSTFHGTLTFLLLLSLLLFVLLPLKYFSFFLSISFAFCLSWLYFQSFSLHLPLPFSIFP